VVKVAQAFVQAINTHNREQFSSVTDPRTTNATWAGTQLTALGFDDIALDDGAFSRRPTVLWTFVELESNLKIKPNVEPIIAEDAALATIECLSGVRIYLRKVEGSWKVFYVGKAENEQKQ
jgi:hypothetical protein